jgi:hypothetical protein
MRPNGIEMSRPASSSNPHYTRFAAAGRVGSIELFGGGKDLVICHLGVTGVILCPEPR